MNNDTMNSSSFPNESNPNQTHLIDFHTRLDWFLPFAITVILMFMSLWTLISLVYYGSMTGKWKKTPTKKSKKLSAGLIYTSVVVCAFLCVLYQASGILYMSVGFNDDEDYLCNIVGDLANCTYGLVLFSVYMFLWLRQRVFYQNQMLNVTYSRTIQAFSSISIIVIIVAGMSVLVFIALPYNHRSSPNGCVYLPDNELRVGYWISVVVVGVFGQTILLGLFFYALKQSRGNRWSKSSKVPCCGTLIDIFYTKAETHDQQGKVQSSRMSIVNNIKKTFRKNRQKSMIEKSHVIRNIIRLTLLFALLSFIMDAVFQVYVHSIDSTFSHRRIDVCLACTSAFANLLLRVLSFSNSKEMLIPFLVRAKGSKTIESD